jgi:hypothetical protein
MNILVHLEQLFQNGILIHYLTDIQIKYDLTDAEMYSLIWSNYEKDKVNEILGDD